MSFPRISKQLPARLTFYEDTFATGADDGIAREFTSLAKLGDFLTRPHKLPVEEDKRKVHFYTRALCEGRRLKKNLRGPIAGALGSTEKLASQTRPTRSSA